MSEVAKDRLVVLGTRFATYEHENALKKSLNNQLSANSAVIQQPNLNTASTDKASFWKKNSSKVPGRLVYTLYFVNFSLLHLSKLSIGDILNKFSSIKIIYR